MSEEEFEVLGEVETLASLDSGQQKDHLTGMGLSEELLAQAIAAAQAVFDQNKVNVKIAEFAVESQTEEEIEKCRCGSRCLYRSEPYTRCWTERNGSRTCISGSRQVCYRTVCNPC